jgi:HPt (histidine-containing phosphotransfer) domain-containing protein
MRHGPRDDNSMSLEWTVPAELLARCLGRLDRVQRVLDAYIAQLNDDLVQLDVELQAGNAVQVARLAHRIKGASANASAESIRAEAESIERLANANQLGELHGCIGRLRAELSQVVDSAARIPLMAAASRDGGA